MSKTRTTKQIRVLVKVDASKVHKDIPLYAFVNVGEITTRAEVKKALEGEEDGLYFIVRDMGILEVETSTKKSVS